MSRRDDPTAPIVVRWYHQSWAVIGGLLLLGVVFAGWFGSALFLALLELAVVASGLWLYYGLMDDSLTSERPAVLELHHWWQEHRRQRLLTVAPDHEDRA